MEGRRTKAAPEGTRRHASILDAMAHDLGEADVRKIAALARLELLPAEIELFARQLSDILAYVDQLQGADTTGITPTSHPLSSPPVWRADDPATSLDPVAVLEQAPDASVPARLFKVPKVL
jgi:aspartyl-tRNA(Asn)/glutamyl-tRNA(Gln) amidotransferase subunit C